MIRRPRISTRTETLFPSTTLFRSGGRRVPKTGPELWKTLRLQALGDGVLDAAVATMLGGKREAQQRSAHWLGRYRAAIVRALEDIEARADDLAGPPTLGQIAVGCAPDRKSTRLNSSH